MLSLIPPVGSRIRFGSDGGYDLNRYRLTTYASGTSALAAALKWCAAEANDSTTEVLMPAYGCPAVVAAALHVGLNPVLVDLAPGSPFMSGAGLEDATSERTLACIHVNFLGVSPPIHRADRHAVREIYDCCQGWPSGGVCPDWADATVVSFGRGKPITVGTGGGLLMPAQVEKPPPAGAACASPSTAKFALSSALYNLALCPAAFWWVDRMPGLHVGETIFRELESIDEMPAVARAHLATNIAGYEKTAGWTVADVNAIVQSMSLAAFMPPEAIASASESRLLRLPLVAASKQLRDRAISKLRACGFGATAMYRVPLWQIAGLTRRLESYGGRCPNAVQFADTLLTLPLHSGVSASTLERMLEVLRRF